FRSRSGWSTSSVIRSFGSCASSAAGPKPRPREDSRIPGQGPAARVRRDGAQGRRRRQPGAGARDRAGARRPGRGEGAGACAGAPEKILREWAHPALGLQPFQARRLAFALGLAGAQQTAGGTLALNLFACYRAKDCSLAEINPLVVTGDGRLLALDAKLTFDD